MNKLKLIFLIIYIAFSFIYKVNAQKVYIHFNNGIKKEIEFLDIKNIMFDYNIIYFYYSNDTFDSWDVFSFRCIEYKGDLGINANIGKFNKTFELYPNPGNKEITIEYPMNNNGIATIDILSLDGEVLFKLCKESEMIGVNKFVWNITDHSGKVLPSGIYLCRITTDEYISSKKIIIN